MTKKYVRVGFTSAQKTELWERWRSGEQMKSIGRELGKRSSSIFSHIRSTGGFTLPVRKRPRLAQIKSLSQCPGTARSSTSGADVQAVIVLSGTNWGYDLNTSLSSDGPQP